MDVTHYKKAIPPNVAMVVDRFGKTSFTMLLKIIKKIKLVDVRCGEIIKQYENCSSMLLENNY